MAEDTTSTTTAADTLDSTKYVTVGQPVEGGAAYVSFKPAATLPDDAAAKASTFTDFESIGEFSDNGYTKSVSVTSNKFKGWHGSVLLTQISEEENTFKLELTDIDRASVAKVRYGVGNVTTDADGNITKIDPTTVPSVVTPMFIDELLSNGRLRRTVFPRPKIDSIDDEAHQKGSLLVYGITFSCANDDKGRPYYIREAEPATA